MQFSGISKSSIRAMPGIKQLLRIKAAHGKEFGHFSGVFDSSEEALASAPTSMRSTWDDEALVENGIPNFSSIHSFDQPVIDHLQQMLKDRQLRVVTDFGGHIGVKHTAYSRVIQFPDDLIWQVVETPAVIAEARRRTAPEARALRFFENLEDTAPCDFLLCSGSLQYVPTSIEQIVNRLPQKPKTIIVNKVAVSRKRPFFTVERYIKSLAYRIYGPSELEECRARLGYKLAASWTIPHRDILVLNKRSIERVRMIGESWTL